MIKYLKTISVVLLLMVCQSVFSGSGLLFNVSATGTPSNVDITLCLNGKGPLSCQHYHVSALALSIRTTAPNHMYPAAGIIVNTPGYKIGNLGVDCTIYENGYCLFSVSNTQSQTIYIAGGQALTANVQPANQTKNSSQSATLTVNASGGTAPYSYQWYSCTDSSCTTETTIAGATNSTYNPSTTVTGTFYYLAVVADAVHAMVTTNVATLTVNSVLSATVTPSSLVANEGQTATFTANPIGGTAPYSYQWYSCSDSSCATATSIAGEINNTYSPSTAATGTYYYQAIVVDETAAAATTNVATLSVNNDLSATVTPMSLSTNVGQMALLMANPIGGTAPFSYQWYLCNNASCTTATLISGATSNTYNPSTATAGTFYYRAIVTDSASTPDVATTNVATVMVNGDLSVTVTPSTLSVNTGDPAQFMANPIAGTIPYIYQWYSCADSSCTSPTLIPGETNSTYNPSTTAAGTYYYRVVATDSATIPDTATSNVATLTVGLRCGTYSLIDIVTTGLRLGSGDDLSFPVTLQSGHPINLYGTSYTALNMSTNGLISSYNNTAYTNTALPTTSITGDTLFVLWGDLQSSDAPQGLYYQYFNVCPRESIYSTGEGCHVFQWRTGNYPGPTGNFDVEAIYYDVSGVVVYQYGSGNPTSGLSATTGAQNTTRTKYTQLSFNATIPDNSVRCLIPV